MSEIKFEGFGKVPKSQPENNSPLMLLLRGAAIILVIFTIIPALNPARMSGLISENDAFFTVATTYSKISSVFTRAINRGWVDSSIVLNLYIPSLLCFLCIIAAGAGCCMTLGRKRLQRLGTFIMSISSGAGIIALMLMLPAYFSISATSKPGSVQPMFAIGFYFFIVIFVVCGLLGFVNMKMIPKPTAEDKYEMDAKYRLFLMILPFVILTFAFAYLPLWGWRYCFYDYTPGVPLSSKNFVGFKWFVYLFQNPATVSDIKRVLINTLGMSGIGIATSFLPMAFAIFLSEIKFGKLKKFVQTATTIPNFIGWVLVYSFAFALFSTEGFVNSVLMDCGLIKTGVNYLMSSSHIWLKLWALGTWKGLGWGAVVYIAAIAGIDQQLYEAAKVDGAGRFRRIWHVTLPGLIPTYCVLLLLGIANILSSGMEVNYIFHNSANIKTIENLDLYVFSLGIGDGNVPLATVIGVLKSAVAVTLLLGANRISKFIRGESIL